MNYRKEYCYKNKIIDKHDLKKYDLFEIKYLDKNDKLIKRELFYKNRLSNVVFADINKSDHKLILEKNKDEYANISITITGKDQMTEQGYSYMSYIYKNSKLFVLGKMEYDTKDRLIKETNYSITEPNKVLDYSIYIYDKDGKLEMIREYNSDGNQISEVEMTQSV